MPTPFTSTFASAAAGTNGDGSGTRKDGTGSNEWSRSRVNGATQTFRRPSGTTATSQSRDIPQTTSNQSNGGVYIPPHLNPSHASSTQRPPTSGDLRYSKDQLLGIFQTQKEQGNLNHQLNTLFSGTWNPLQNDAWIESNSKTEGKDAIPGPEICWHHTIRSDPLALQDMTEEEKEIFSTSVNSPLKLQSTTTKDGPSMGTTTGRKTSLSYSNTPGGSSRPGARRRETLENLATNGPLSPTESKSFFRTESNTATPPPALLRRRTDFKEEDIGSKDVTSSADDPTDSQSAFPSARKLMSGPLSAGLNPPSASPWSAGPQSAGGFGSMGSFGSFAIGTPTSAIEVGEKRPGFGSARGSRFKDLLTKSSTEDMSSGTRDKSNFGGLGKLAEENPEGRSQRPQDTSRTRAGRSETNPYDESVLPAGSAALGGSQEASGPEPGVEHFGFSNFTASAAPGSRDFGNPDSAIHQTPQGKFDLRDPTSPTNTNPYQSPAVLRNDEDDQESAEAMPSAPGAGPFGSARRNVFGTEDRSSFPPGPQRSTSGFGGFPSFGGIGGPTWSSAGLGGGTPIRERGLASSGAFGDPIFSPLPDLQSPGGGLGSGFFGSGAFGSARGTSRLGAMFPPAMQEQMRGDSRNEMQPGSSEGRPGSAQAASIHDPFDSTSRRRDDVFARGPNAFDDTLGHHVDDAAGAFGQIAPGPAGQASAPVAAQRLSGGDTAQSGHGLSQSSGSSSSNQMPAAQQRQMVMPDRMRWIYRDPQGNVQGPWSGLEMHDWFKAGFFTAELQVKKLEDAEYEPLAQLVRRIGNSREPFLVPQIGIPHGPPPNQGNNWATTTMGTGSAQPPFASSFPSFGTTLTAEQQNALERRKQEEQYLMARQKEHLAQQQALMKQMQAQTGGHGLHSLQHHASAHSLHSQPSFSSITSPGGYQPSPMQGPIQPPQTSSGFGPAPTSFGPPFGSEARPARDDELHTNMDRLSFNQRAGFAFSTGAVGALGQELGLSSHPTVQDRTKLQQQQQQSDMRSHQDTFLGPSGQNPRLEEFRSLQGQTEALSGRTGLDQALPQPIGAPRVAEEPPITVVAKPQQPIGHSNGAQKLATPADTETLSLAQQIQRTAAANQQAATETDVIPPPLSISPLPAPAAQRNRQHVADALAAESRSATQTPTEATSISLAPWAERTTEIPKGPSLKEIQEAEAKRAAKQEEIASAARRAQAEQERSIQAQAPPPIPGLPVSSTWATNATPTSAISPSTSVWSKPTPGKSAAIATANIKKTLAQIQKEEENRKQKAAAAAAAASAAAALQTSTGNPAAVAGKRYAELASKIAPSTSPASTGTGAWTTVGSGGKTKTPAAVVATPQAASRTVSTGTVPTATKARPALQTARSNNVANQNKANDEFAKWIKASLGKGLNSNINVDNFIQDLLQLPPEIEIISDSVYASSQTLDGRRFAEEFVRRRKLADKGIVEPANSGTTVMVVGGAMAGEKSGVGGGWSEVAKKGPPSSAAAGGAVGGAAQGKDDTAAAAAGGSPSFKVVAKKKGKR